jgi:hypothetical protein
VSGVGSGLLDIAGRTGVLQTVQTTTGSLANSATSAAGTAVKGTLVLAAVPAVVYAAYWRYNKPKRDALKTIKEKLAPEIPTVEAGNNKKAKYRIFNWKLTEYPTAGKLNEIKHNNDLYNRFLNDLASDIINNEFKGIDPNLCTNVAGERVSNMQGVQLTREAARQIIIEIQREKPILGQVLEALKGEQGIDLASLEQVLHNFATGDVAAETNGIATTDNYISYEGWRWPKRMIGLRGNVLGFNYAAEYQKACREAGLNDEAMTKPSEMNPTQYAAVDKRMKEYAKITMHKFLFGSFHYAQAARLYWSTYKKLHRLEAIENMLNARMHGLPTNNRPVGQHIYVHRQQ